MAINARVRSMASGLRGYSHQLQFLLSARALTDEIIAATGEALVVKHLILVDFARAIIAVGPPDSRGVAAVIKIARNRDAAQSMDHHRRALLELRADPRVADLLSILPEEIAWGTIGDQAYVVERALPGIDARRLLEDAARCSRMLAAAMDTVAMLHERTARTVTVDRTMTRGWIDEPLRKIRALRASYPRIALYDEAMDELGESLTNDLIGRQMAICWLH